MKKHVSVFYLIARESVYRISLLWLCSVVLQSALFLLAAKDEAVELIPSVSDVFVNSGIAFVFYITFIITAVLLCKTGMQFNTKTGYTLRRLRTGEKTVVTWQFTYNALVVFLCMVFEILLCFALANAATRILPEKFITSQSVYLAFYNCNFLQSLFAGRDVMRIVRNIVTVISLAINFSAFSYLFRRGKKWIGAILVTAAVFFVFVRPEKMSVLEFDVLMLSVMVLLIFIAAAAVIRRDRHEA